jgi:hypothetical protein
MIPAMEMPAATTPAPMRGASLASACVRRSRWARRVVLSVIGIGIVLTGVSTTAGEPTPASAARALRVVRRFEAEEARQGVAADGGHIYAIGDRAIGKYDKASGGRVASWRGEGDEPIVHLNGGVVLDGKLYCAHSNYPDVPMTSSIEIFDAARLEHVASHSFGIFEGSATWIDRRDGHWWVAFAHYEGRGGEAGKGPAWTSLVKLDDGWRRVEGFVYPPEVVARFGNRSNSGGAWGRDGFLYATGHDAPEVYVLQLPQAGSALRLVATLPAAGAGQGIAWDPVERGVLYGIVKESRTIVVSRLVEE